MDQSQKAKLFNALHHTGRLLILPNIWDVSGALLLQDLQYPAVATASFSIAVANGYRDGENIPFNELLFILSKITGKVNLPVSADIESGYAETKAMLTENIKRLLETGIVGINIEDTNKKTKKLYSAQEQCERIAAISDVSKKSGIDLFINARTDVLLRQNGNLSSEDLVEETVQRGLQYKAAGASGFYPITMKNERDLKKVVAEVGMPVNVVTVPGIPKLKELELLGIARISLGPSFLKIAIRAMKTLAEKLKHLGGETEVIENEITSDYLHMLVNNNSK